MPDHRLTPKREGFSDKITALDHLAYRVWQQYKLSADDYGVMPDLAASIQAGNRRLAQEPVKAITAALAGFVDGGLLHRFVHQGQAYLYSRVWQTHQKVRYPSETFHPVPPAEELAQCDAKTRALFAQRCANGSETVLENSGTTSGPPTRACPGNANANADATASDVRGESERGLVLSPGQLRSSAPALVSMWNARAVEPFVRVADTLAAPSRLRVEAALKAHPDLDWWDARFGDVMTSAFCRGGGERGWVADFWWALENADTIATGRYRDRSIVPKTKVQAVTQDALARVLARELPS